MWISFAIGFLILVRGFRWYAILIALICAFPMWIFVVFGIFYALIILDVILQQLGAEPIIRW